MEDGDQLEYEQTIKTLNDTIQSQNDQIRELTQALEEIKDIARSHV